MSQTRGPLKRKTLQEIRCAVFQRFIPYQQNVFQCLISISDVLSYLRKSNVSSCNQTCQQWLKNTPVAQELFTTYEFGRRGGVPPLAFWLSDLSEVSEFVGNAPRRNAKKLTAAKFKAAVSDLERVLRHQWQQNKLVMPREGETPDPWSLVSTSRLAPGFRHSLFVPPPPISELFSASTNDEEEWMASQQSSASDLSDATLTEFGTGENLEDAPSFPHYDSMIPFFDEKDDMIMSQSSSESPTEFMDW